MAVYSSRRKARVFQNTFTGTDNLLSDDCVAEGKEAVETVTKRQRAMRDVSKLAANKKNKASSKSTTTQRQIRENPQEMGEVFFKNEPVSERAKSMASMEPSTAMGKRSNAKRKAGADKVKGGKKEKPVPNETVGEVIGLKRTGECGKQAKPKNRDQSSKGIAQTKKKPTERDFVSRTNIMDEWDVIPPVSSQTAVKRRSKIQPVLQCGAHLATIESPPVKKQRERADNTTFREKNGLPSPEVLLVSEPCPEIISIDSITRLAVPSALYISDTALFPKATSTPHNSSVLYTQGNLPNFPLENGTLLLAIEYLDSKNEDPFDLTTEVNRMSEVEKLHVIELAVTQEKTALEIKVSRTSSAKRSKKLRKTVTFKQGGLKESRLEIGKPDPELPMSGTILKSKDKSSTIVNKLKHHKSNIAAPVMRNFHALKELCSGRDPINLLL
ncbi:hypothetical protein BABINDRAFT_124095 [Babjeviella inositovora NRRL Y-12698]|uniref:Uncharacterized protein n=1 Tax=Babjeviella inositovora NRRL Y-12698 TaxID=984486 RepID=A0A1E3QUQ0_9ASCO|nr:uncharacterized protein BABINDRAFT_124095 [Babjeviella inositovora NRRL Y-12698]ODQ81401.1 hypothetical protein BABINDRAFT_124095 [Babjeviella inositovora NRRL Y-12698]